MEREKKNMPQEIEENRFIFSLTKMIVGVSFWKDFLVTCLMEFSFL